MSEMAGVEVIPIDLTEIIGDIEIPCDWHRIFRCGPKGATWLVALRCGCGARDQRLVCEGCKSVAMSMEEGLYCPVDCGEVFIPARRAIAYMERI